MLSKERCRSRRGSATNISPKSVSTRLFASSTGSILLIATKRISRGLSMTIDVGQSTRRRCRLPAPSKTLESFESELKAALNREDNHGFHRHQGRAFSRHHDRILAATGLVYTKLMGTAAGHCHA